MIRAAGIARIALPVPDLGEARMAWTRLGFTLGPRLAEPAIAVASETILLQRGMVALTNGPLAIDIDAPGLAEGDVLLRQVELPEASVALHERRLAVAGPCFLWHEAGPTLGVRPEWLAHANGAVALAGVLAVVEDALAQMEIFEQALGPAAVTSTDDTLTLRVGGETILLASPDDAAAMYPEADDFSLVLRLHVADLPRAADTLADWRIDFDEASGRLLVPPDEASGVLLELIGPR